MTAAALIAFAIWPLVHFKLTSIYGLDPWKFGGWAMYVVPHRNPSLLIHYRDSRGWHELTPEQTSAEFKQELRAFIPRRSTWGKLELPNKLAARFLDDMPSAKKLRVTVEKFSLDKDARVLLARSTYLCVRHQQTICKQRHKEKRSR